MARIRNLVGSVILKQVQDDSFNDMKTYSTPILLVIAILTLAVDGAVFYALYREEISLTHALLLHLVVSAILLLWVLKLHKSRHGYDLKSPLLLSVLTLVTGPFGCAIFIIQLLFYLIFRRTSSPFAEWLASLFPEDKHDNSEDLYERLIFGQEDFSDKTSIMPFNDIIALGTEDQKRTVIAKITRHFSSKFAPALVMATQDEQNAIRVQAATAISNIEHEFAQSCISLEKKLAAEPGNHEVELKLAQQYDGYALCGLIDREREEYFRQKAILHYENYVHSQDDAIALFALGRQYIRNGEPAKARQVLNACLALQEKPRPNILMWYMQSLFETHDFIELNKFSIGTMHLIDGTDSTSYKAVEMLKLWAGGYGKNKGDDRAMI